MSNTQSIARPSLHDLLHDQHRDAPTHPDRQSAPDVVSPELLAAFCDQPVDLVAEFHRAFFEFVDDLAVMDGVLVTKSVAIGQYFGKCLVGLACYDQAVEYEFEGFEFSTFLESNPSLTFVGVDAIAEAVLDDVETEHFAAVEMRAGDLTSGVLDLLTLFAEKVAIDGGNIAVNGYRQRIVIDIPQPSEAV